MKVLRSTMYDPELSPVTLVMRDLDLIEPVERVADVQTPGAFTISDIFEMPDDDLAEAIVTAMDRQVGRERREKDMAILYYWDASQLRILNAEGLLSTTLPAPLSREEIKVTLKQLAIHPDYQRQTIAVHAEDGTLVEMKAGKIL